MVTGGPLTVYTTGLLTLFTVAASVTSFVTKEKKKPFVLINSFSIVIDEDKHI